jgi:hypothetical protein
MIAMAITLGIGAIVFQLFLQNEQVFRDQNLVIEMQQSTRAVVSMINDDLRMAGQGVPVHASTFGGTPTEATQTFLNGSGANAILFRAGVRNGVASVNEVVTPLTPWVLTAGTASTMDLASADPIAAIIGNATDRYAFVWGKAGNLWTWSRTRISVVDAAMDRITLVPDQISTLGGSLQSVPHLALEEVVGYTLVGNEIRRGQSGDFTNIAAPAMTDIAVGNHFTTLAFTYLDDAGNAVTPATLADRASIRGVSFTVIAQTAQPLASTGVARTYGMSMTVYPRNVAFY